MARLHERLGEHAGTVRFIHGEITQLRLPERQFRLWHDRAVFHFLTTPAERQRYVELAAASLEPGGYLVVATFANDGPRQCSKLDVVNYDAAALAAVFGKGFELVGDERESHVMLSGKTQAFQYAILHRVDAGQTTIREAAPASR